MINSIPHYTADSIALPPPIDRTKYDSILAKVPDLGAIGICGAHRTGKSTLAKALSKKIKLPFIEIGTSAIFAEYKLDPVKSMEFGTRLWIQSRILRHAVDIWASQSEPFICDRTPIDMMAYTLSEVGSETLSGDMEWELQDYLADCRLATQRYFKHLVFVPRAISIKSAKGKGSASLGYVDHIDALCYGLWHRSGVSGYEIDVDSLGVERRVSDVVRYLNI